MFLKAPWNILTRIETTPSALKKKRKEKRKALLQRKQFCPLSCFPTLLCMNLRCYSQSKLSLVLSFWWLLTPNSSRIGISPVMHGVQQQVGAVGAPTTATESCAHFRILTLIPIVVTPFPWEALRIHTSALPSSQTVSPRAHPSYTVNLYCKACFPSITKLNLYHWCRASDSFFEPQFPQLWNGNDDSSSPQWQCHHRCRSLQQHRVRCSTPGHSFQISFFSFSQQGTLEWHYFTKSFQTYITVNVHPEFGIQTLQPWAMKPISLH